MIAERKMSPREQISITLKRDIVKQLNRQTDEYLSRSRLIEKIIASFFNGNVKKKKTDIVEMSAKNTHDRLGSRSI